jgi:hypothetical protein
MSAIVPPCHGELYYKSIFLSTYHVNEWWANKQINPTFVRKRRVGQVLPRDSAGTVENRIVHANEKLPRGNSTAPHNSSSNYHQLTLLQFQHAEPCTSTRWSASRQYGSPASAE